MVSGRCECGASNLATDSPVESEKADYGSKEERLEWKFGKF